jgi:hypothetical protein
MQNINIHSRGCTTVPNKGSTASQKIKMQMSRGRPANLSQVKLIIPADVKERMN